MNGILFLYKSLLQWFIFIKIFVKMSKKRPIFTVFFVLICLVGFVVFWLKTPPAQQEQTVAPNDNANTPPKTYTTPTYAVDEWTASPKKSLDDIDGILALAGAGAIDDSTLDFDGKPAKQYRFHHKASAPFWLSVSDDYVEVFWYYAHAKDDELHKNLSQEYAKKAHAITTAILGKNGTAVIKTILTGKSATANGLAYAECKHYECRVVFKR